MTAMKRITQPTVQHSLEAWRHSWWLKLLSAAGAEDAAIVDQPSHGFAR